MNSFTEKLRALRLSLEAYHEANPPHWAWSYVNVFLMIAGCVIAVGMLRDEPSRIQSISAVFLLIVCGGPLILIVSGWLAGWGK